MKLFQSLKSKCDEFGLKLESCAENVPTEYQVGCISKLDIEIMGVDIELVGSSRQRRGCLCPSNKVELIKGKPQRCENKCMYCFWK